MPSYPAKNMCFFGYKFQIHVLWCHHMYQKTDGFPWKFVKDRKFGRCPVIIPPARCRVSWIRLAGGATSGLEGSLEDDFVLCCPRLVGGQCDKLRNNY